MADGFVVQGQDLGCARGDRLLFAGLSFTLGPGEALAVRGGNGNGKTTLLRALGGFSDPARGTIAIGPRDAPSTRREERLLACAYVGHQDGLKPSLTPMETVHFWSHLYDGEGDPAAALDAMGLRGRDHLPARVLSAGQRRRLSLARLLIVRRKVWVLDEPAASLDAASVGLLEGMISRHRKGGGIAIVALHGDLALPDAMTCRIGGEGAT